MTKITTWAVVCMLGFVATVAACLLTASAQDGKKDPADDLAVILGAWESTDRHVALASLFQPEHGVRKREAIVHFARAGDRLTGHAVAESPERENERTDFRTVTFAGGRLTIEFDISFSKKHGPLAVEQGKVGNKGVVRIEAQLQ